MTVAERFATFRYYCLMHVYARVGLTLTTLTKLQGWSPQMEISNLRAPYMGQSLANHGKTTIVVLDAVHSGLTILR